MSKKHKAFDTKKWHTKQKMSKHRIYKDYDSNSSIIYDTYMNFNSPYCGWKIFFDKEDYKEDSHTVHKIEAVGGFLNRHKKSLVYLLLESIENGIVFTIDICELYSDKIFLDSWPDFKKDMHENPFHTLNCFKLAVHQKILCTQPRESLESINIVTALSAIRLRIINYQPIMCLQDLKANFYGRLISIRGCVIRVGHIKHLAQWIVFACCKCNLQILMKQSLGVYTIPKTCNTCGISKFRPMLDSPQVRTVFFQIIKIQELSNDDQNNKGNVPRMLDIELIDDLVNTCMPGDDITLTGIIKETSDGRSKNKISFSLCMEAITIVNNKQGFQNKTIVNNEMSVKDYLAIKEVYNTPNIFPLLVHSLCPSIYGHEIVKAGMILSLFGGNSEYFDLRESIHTLVIGDPGLGKSQMLQACARIATKGVYICGNSSTTSGLSITLAKENKNNNYILEPGALILADRGCCCIDEFDKMYKQHAILLEAMEQQCISVAKSGVICSFPTRTSILAAANPVSGRFHRNKTVMQNLKMNAPLLSRFDLIFLLLDEPNQQVDDLLFKHVVSSHDNSNVTKRSKGSISQCNSDITKLSLRDKLAFIDAESVNIIPHPILRKYIAYARQYVKSKLTKEAGKILQKYYLELRSTHNKFYGLSVCNRHLEAMIRLTEARAKLELRTETTEEDALDIIEILQYTFENEIISSKAACTRNISNGKVKEFIKMLRKDTLCNNSNIFFTKTLHEILLNMRVPMDDISGYIMKLNECGILLKTGSNAYKFISN